VIFLQILSNTGLVFCQLNRTQANGEVWVYHDYELNAIQKMWAAWNSSTPEKSRNLAGWSSTQTLPCESDLGYYQGVTCIRPFCENIPEWCNNNWYQVKILGLSISNASIVGTLPDVFWHDPTTYLPSLSTLEITGNPGLSGPLPVTLNNTWLYVLDLHDNAFNGTIPSTLVFLRTLEYLDLGGNELTGEYPLQLLRKLKNSVRTLSIGRNKFYGPIRYDAFQNKTKLLKLDISSNNFTGTLPDLSYNTELQYLDVSRNQFEGPLPNLTEFANLRYVNLGGNLFNGTLAKLSDIVNISVITTLDISDNHLTGPLLPNLKREDLGVVTTLQVSGNHFHGHIPDLSLFQDITIMNLSGNQLTLPPNWNVYKIGSIQELYLDNNNITGPLDIAKIFTNDRNQSSTLSLKVLSLENNLIEDVTFTSEHIKNRAFIIKLLGNPYCDSVSVNGSVLVSDDAKRCFCKQICFISPANKADRRKIIAISVATSTALVALVVAVVVGAILFKNRRYKRYLRQQFQQKFEEFNVKPTIYSYQELKVATRDFHEENKLGQGGYGAVYKGVLPNGSKVAVKQLFSKQSQTGLDEFSNEVVLITGMKHRNLVNLRGCCLREGSRILVYDYVDNFDVNQILLEKGPRRQSVPWPSRLKICLGIAHGLHYLHALACPRVIHRDVKASNILLDKNLEPKVADFGLALLFPDEESHLMTVHVAGTKGYLAPEYATLGQLSDKVDVYSFGVVCLEIISGRRNIDESLPLEQVYLTPWAWKLHLANKLLELVDPTLHLSNSEEEEDVQRVIKIALMCTQVASTSRPSMNQVVSMLQRDTQSNTGAALDGGEHELVRFDVSKWAQTANSSGLTPVSEENGSWSSSYGFSIESQHILRDHSSGTNSINNIELSDIRGR
jgi:serine/threonine protein kinase